MDKRIKSAETALASVKDGASVMIGGFGLCGIPEYLIAALAMKGTKDLTVISNNAGVDDFGIGILINAGQVRRMVSSYVGENRTFEKLALEDKLEVELNPQGTLAERIRAGGAGIPAFFTPTGYGTTYAEGKEVRTIDGRPYLLVNSLHADVAFIKAWKGDRWGNLVYRKTAGNFNHMMATAASFVVAEVEEMVELGELSPNCIDTPGIFVDAILRGSHYVKRIERRRVRNPNNKETALEDSKRERIARRLVQELHDGDYVNLGIGLPTLVAAYLPEDLDIIIHTENGMLGVGPYPHEGLEDPDLINAGKETISEVPGCSYVSSADSFGMVRGGHIDVTILGALEVDEKGNLANWQIPGKMLKGMGGAMDLVAGARRVVIGMEHITKEGSPRILKRCGLPLTGTQVVDLIVTDLAVIEVTPGGLLLRELAHDTSIKDVQSLTEPILTIASDLKVMQL